MLQPGLCSVGFRGLDWQEVLSLCVQAQLKGIEWNAAHVAPGELELARRVRLWTEGMGLVNCSYGSYYRAGVSEAAMPFERVLETAVNLGAPLVRIWAGNQNAEELSESARAEIVQDLMRVGDLAAVAGVQVGLEYHGNTLTNSQESTARLMAEVPHPAVRFYWQPPTASTPAVALESLRQVLPRLAYVHVFHWTGPAADLHRHPLAAAKADWLSYLQQAAEAPDGANRWALLEFTRDDSPLQMIEDAKVLAELLRER